MANKLKQNSKKKPSAKKMRMLALDKYDVKGYYRDLEYLGKLSYLPQSTKDWIEARMYELRSSANVYEHIIGELLIKKNVDFIHQAPFVFRPRTIYFCDFFLPKDRIVIEVDGIYHSGQSQLEKDKERDSHFKSIGIRVIRVHNEETRDVNRLAIRLSQYIIGIA